MIGTKFIKDASGNLTEESDNLYTEAARWCNETQRGYIVDKGGWYEVVAVPETTLEEAKTTKLSEINAACDAILDSAVSSYPQSEILTFDQQVEEVRTYQQTGNPASAPLLSALAGARGISLDELCLRVITKRAQFSTLSGIIIGQRQHLEDVLDTLETVEAVQALEVDIGLPIGQAVDPPDPDGTEEDPPDAEETEEQAAGNSGFSVDGGE